MNMKERANSKVKIFFDVMMPWKERNGQIII